MHEAAARKTVIKMIAGSMELVVVVVVVEWEGEELFFMAGYRSKESSKKEEWEKEGRRGEREVVGFKP